MSRTTSVFQSSEWRFPAGLSNERVVVPTQFPFTGFLCGVEAPPELRDSLRIDDLLLWQRVCFSTRGQSGQSDGVTIDELNRHLARRPIAVYPYQTLTVSLRASGVATGPWRLSWTLRTAGLDERVLLPRVEEIRAEFKADVSAAIDARLNEIGVSDALDDIRDQIAELRDRMDGFVDKEWRMAVAGEAPTERPAALMFNAVIPPGETMAIEVRHDALFMIDYLEIETVDRFYISDLAINDRHPPPFAQPGIPAAAFGPGVPRDAKRLSFDPCPANRPLILWISSEHAEPRPFSAKMHGRSPMIDRATP